MIRWTYAFIDRPADVFTEAASFWSRVTGTHLTARRGEHGEFATLLPIGADACVKLQAVDEGGGAHLDLSVDDPAALAARAVELGATHVADRGYQVLRSPGGMLFCAVPWHDEFRRPMAHATPDGALSRLDQVCIDVGPAAYDAETAFWGELTGWESSFGSRPEFHVVAPPAELPVRILLQRLQQERPTSAHLDLACSDVEGVRAWHEKCGASHVADGARWVVMRDPAGGVYCLTARDPKTGGLPGK
ncbi:VOC family protein [Catellatospora vulcania]|uniref:VOC family protein n=1 Tax=Catellatospora vulcania TaxID=1460450 RepID=UPI0012D3EA4B|nr:VOC family protein [Catellatospora vulcania]